MTSKEYLENQEVFIHKFISDPSMTLQEKAKHLGITDEDFNEIVKGRERQLYLGKLLLLAYFDKRWTMGEYAKKLEKENYLDYDQFHDIVTQPWFRSYLGDI